MREGLRERFETIEERRGNRLKTLEARDRRRREGRGDQWMRPSLARADRIRPGEPVRPAAEVGPRQERHVR